MTPIVSGPQLENALLLSKRGRVLDNSGAAVKFKRVTIGMLTIGAALALNGCGNNDDKRFLDALRRDTTTYTVNDDETLTTAAKKLCQYLDSGASAQDVADVINDPRTTAAQRSDYAVFVNYATQVYCPKHAK